MRWVEPTAGAFGCRVAMAVFLTGLALLAMRLKDVQVEDAADYGYASARQSVRRVQTAGSRGAILDRHGEMLAENRRVLSLVCDPAVFQQRTWEATTAAIVSEIARLQALGITSPLAEGEIRRHVDQSLAMPLVVRRELDERMLAQFCEHECEFPGFAVAETEERCYPQGRLAAHLLGYVGRDRGETPAGDEKFNFYLPEMRGRSGLELHYDGFLRGVAGEEKLLVDARGFAIRRWTAVEPLAGPDLTLTLDAALQRTVEAQLQGQRGACVVLDPRNGEVLSLASAPGYDPNDFVPSLSHALYERYRRDQAKPLLNRAAGGLYAPGSTFKPVTALAGLAAGHAADETLDCTGVFTLGQFRLNCSRRWGHGPLDLVHALRESCNPYFCRLGVEVGTNALIAAARALGLGNRTGIDFGVDPAGTVPDGEWKMATYGEKWYTGDLAQMAIGQGMLLVTPLQMARLAGAIGTGRLVTPHLRLGGETEAVALPFAARQLAVVREGMRLVVAGGTGHLAGEGLTVTVAGKTGTAEVGAGERRRKNVWFIAYAPATAPEVALAMVIENGESGGSTAAPRVRAILASIFGETAAEGEG